MDDLSQVRLKRDVLHYMLGAALIEIRASSSITAAQKFADVFHNLPMNLLKCSTSEDYDKEFMKLLERARRSGLDEYLKELREVAMRSLTQG